MGEHELFTLVVAIAIVMVIGEAVASRLEVPEAIVLLVLGVLASLIPQVPDIDPPPNLVLFLFLAARSSGGRSSGEVDEDTASVYRQLFEMRLERVRAALGDTDGDGPGDTSSFRAELVRAQRDKLDELYRARKISDEIRRSISRTLDLHRTPP